jgi:hypothetical protein
MAAMPASQRRQRADVKWFPGTLISCAHDNLLFDSIFHFNCFINSVSYMLLASLSRSHWHLPHHTSCRAMLRQPFQPPACHAHSKP